MNSEYRSITAARLLASAALILPWALAAQSASAQSAKTEKPTEAQTADIVVTGQKRSENAQGVPKQVTIASQVQLTTAGVNRLVDLFGVFPAITPTSVGQNPLNPGIRGIAPVSGQIGVPSQTGIVVDDFPQATFSTLSSELADVERIEVFAGPQSTLSGRNAASGLINFVTRSPSRVSDFRFGVEQTSDRQTRITAFLTGPLSSTVAYSLSGFYNKWDGNLVDPLLNNERLGGFDSKGVRGKLRWEPTSDL